MKIGDYIYYILVFVLSLIMLLFLPMLGTEIGVELELPDTTTGWIVYVSTKILVASLNVLMFHCFMQQALVNVKSDERFLEAARKERLIVEKQKRGPRSPARWKAKQYGFKAASIFITSLGSAFVLTAAVLAFDMVSFLTYLFTTVMGLIFGVIQMKSAEEYWLEEYPAYVDQRSAEDDQNR